MRVRMAFLIMLFWVSCIRPPSHVGIMSAMPGVTGTVWFKPAWPATEFPKPDSSYFVPRRLEGIKVSLLEFHGDNQKAGKTVSSETTDSAGLYRLYAKPGTYFLVIYATELGGTVLAGGPFDYSDGISDYAVVELKKRQVIEHDFIIHPLIAQ